MSWADKFNLLNPIVDLRLICALFFIPHIVGKFTEPATLGFFKAAKFNPPATWMYIAGGIETRVLGEYLARRDWRQAGRVGFGTWLGMLLAAAGKLALIFTMVGIFLTAYVL